MKIAVASTGNTVAPHFALCRNFNIYETSDDSVIEVQTVPNPGDRPGFLPDFLGNLGAEVIIAGSMADGIIERFHDHHIEVVLEANGDAAEAATHYLNGTLKPLPLTDSIYPEHESAEK